MNDHADLSPLDVLILARLLPVGEKAETLANIQKALTPLLEHRWPGAGLTTMLERSLIGLASRGLIARPVPESKSKKKGNGPAAAPPIQLTPEGRQTALAVLGVRELPEKPKPTWGKLKTSLLSARALGLAAPPAKFPKGASIKAAVLSKALGLSLGDYPTMKDVKAAWTRRQLGMGPKQKVSLETVQALLACRELGEHKPSDPTKAFDRLVSRAIGARRDTAAEHHDTILRRWIDGTGLEPAPFDLAALAARVKATAGRCQTGRFGDDKVFVAHVWDALRGDPAVHGLDLAAFKQRLAEANNARLLDLSRADLVEAMNPEDVRRSEISYLNATFHFIRTAPERQ